MIRRTHIARLIYRLFALSALLFAGMATAQPHASAPPRVPVAPAVPLAQAQAISDKDLAATQDELIRLLRLSPTLTTVVARDPSLLSNEDYVSRNNPQLAQFLQRHPEVALNPDFYLFTHLHVEGGSPDEALEREVWPVLSRPGPGRPVVEIIMSDLAPFLVFVCILSALLWLTRVFLENRRWGRIFKLQMDVHGKLIDKFASTQELHSYMGTEAGRKFLEAAPIPIDFEREQRMPSAVARVLTPLQIGIVLSLLGTGLLFLRHSHPDMEIPMLVLGTVVLMPGLGFIISAAVTWVLATRLGMMPDGAAASRMDSGLNQRDSQ